MSQIEYEEQKYFDFVNECLKKEKENCKKELIEVPKKYTKASQGDAFLVEELMSMAATRLRRLELVENNPYFGRIDFLAKDAYSKNKIYIGKTNISSGNSGPAVTDWRTPICSLYYESDLGQTSYDSPSGPIQGNLQLKRQILIKEGKLLDILDTNIASNDELLQPYLSINADNKMKNIIASIQKEQNKIIRKPITENIIVQGVAGSGKTSVAMHRIAYLIYNSKESVKANNFLVIGPNKCFLDYISTILPELETEPVEQKTYLDLVNYYLNEKLILKDDGVIEKNTEDANVLKKIQYYKSSLQYKEALNKFMKVYLDKGIVSKGIVFDGEEIYSVNDIKNRLFSDIGSKPNFKKTCDYFVNDFKYNMDKIYSKLNEKYRMIYIKLPKDDPKRKEAIEKSTELSICIKKKGVQSIKDYFKKINLKALDIYKIFVNSIEEYDDTLSKSEIAELQKNTLLSSKQKKVTFEDLPSLLYIDNCLNGNNLQYRHVIIDEAQDYGLFHFDALKTKFPNSTFSVFGDLAQSIYSYRSVKNWESVVSNIFNEQCSLLNLNKSYRTTIEITNNANKLLDKMNLFMAEPVIRHGAEITFSKDCSKDCNYKISKINEWISKGYKTIAIICKTDKEALQTYKSLIAKGIDIKMITSKENTYSGGLFVLTSSLSKGLEFDAVMINDASNNIYSDNSTIDMHLLYVACTRPLHELNILYEKNLCNVFYDNNKIDCSNEKYKNLRKVK